MILSVLCVVLLVSSGFTEEVFSYHGYKVYQVFPKTLDQARLLNTLENNENFDFWTDIRYLNKPVDIMVSAIVQHEFEDLLKKENIDYAITINDVEVEVEKGRKRQRTSVTRGNVTFAEFMRHDEINAYLQRLADDYPHIVKTDIIGKTFEGRDLILIRISKGGINKPTIFAEAAIHAREWIAPPVALYVINQLVENANNSHMYEDVDWAIIPLLNADGYEYTHTTARFWRKTRSPGTICDGVDGNRNFDAAWGLVGASRWQCDNTYPGYTVFSEPETQAIRDYILSHKENIKLFLDIHSHGRWFLYPWGYTFDEPDNINDLRHVGQLFNDAIYAATGGNYTVTSFVNGLYYAAGTSVDWVKTIGIDLAYTIELPAGGSGFDPPPTSIQLVVEETWEGVKALHNYIQTTFVN